MKPIAYGGNARMIRSGTIKNFRCFESAALNDCKTLNVVLGSNASGKTTLLEAILMTLSNGPETANSFRMLRGIQSAGAPLDPVMDRAIWSDLFFDLDANKSIAIDFVGDPAHHRSLTITYGKSFVPQFMGGNQLVQASPICFTYVRPNQPKIEVRAVPVGPMGIMGAGSWVYINAETIGSNTLLVASNAVGNSQPTMLHFSQLKVAKKTEAIIDECKREFPFIRNIEIASPLNVASIFVEISDKFGMIPIGQISTGVSKIFAILTALAYCENGIVLIDEIENGIYYDRYEALWRTVYAFAKKANSQIFATTHSKECLEALSRVSEEWVDDISFIRTTRGESGSTLEQFHGRSMFDAMRIGEIR